MISPAESHNPLHSFETVNLLALLVYVDSKGNHQPINGFDGEVMYETATEISPKRLWVITSGARRGQVVQYFPRGSRHLNRVALHPTAKIASPWLIVSAFENGLATASRGMRHAERRVLSELEAFLALNQLSDDALMYALETNLRHDDNVAVHQTNIDELDELVRSNGNLAEEIRNFLNAFRNRMDRTSRHNVWRCVLIVRAVQRRAKIISDDKHRDLDSITTVTINIARYIGAVVTLASRIRTEMSDAHPWWICQRAGLSQRELEKRLHNFRIHLRQHVTDLSAVHADPFRCFAETAVWHLQAMLIGYQTSNYSQIIADANQVEVCMQSILACEGLSITA